MRGSHWPGEPLSASSDNNPDVQRLVLAGQQHIADIMDPETFSKHLLGFCTARPCTANRVRSSKLSRRSSGQ
jgi:hypothetical protein